MTIYDTAHRAEHARDLLRFYQSIRELAPKQPFHRIQLRSTSGALLGASEAADALLHWYQDLYAANDSIENTDTCTWPFTLDELQYGLSQTPTMKALDPNYVPAPFWRATSQSVSQYLHPYFCESCEHGELPSCWGHGTLTFLIKPNTRGHAPSELRPITLLEPTGKALLGTFSTHLLAMVLHRLARLPQFAYLPARGTEEALGRLRQHCINVRDLLQNNKFRIHQQATNTERNPVAGGMILSLDLQKAFDSVLRSKLIEALRALGVDNNLINILIQFYHQSSFSFRHRGQTRTFRTFRGIRQGCKSAPLLWACFAGYLLEHAMNMIDPQWILDMVTGFADDFCLHQTFTSSADVHHAIQNCGRFLDVLHESGLTVNMKKTVVVFKLLGRDAHKLLKRYVKRTKDGTFLLLPKSQHGHVLIKMVSHISYLGTILHYNNFERSTMNNRIKSATKVSHQLTRWIHTNNRLTFQQKTRLWYQCVYPCVIYGIRQIGFTVSTLLQLDRFCMTQLGRIWREPTFLHHLSHTDFLQQFGIADPLWRLRHQLGRAIAREQRRRSQSFSDDIIHTLPQVDDAQQCQVIDAVLDLQRGQAQWEEVIQSDHQCEFCDRWFSSIAQLRRHQTLAHEQRSGQLRTPSMHDIKHGVPTCVRCGQMFTTWHRLRHHVTFICIQELNDDGPDLEHRLRVRELLQLAEGLNLAALGQQHGLCDYFKHRCILCGTYICFHYTRSTDTLEQ